VRQIRRKPAIPRMAGETVRQAIVALLDREPTSALDISAAVRVPEKEVYGHLEHIRRSLHAEAAELVVTPAECRSCGFIFVKRDRLAPPGKCPVCRHEAILDPLFSIRRLHGHKNEADQARTV
jgi:transcriptional regulator